MIRETIVTTVSAHGIPHIAPIGLIETADGWVIAPFRPSTTLENLRAVPYAVANHTDDVRVFAGCVTGRSNWPCVAADHVPPPRLRAILSHTELAVTRVADDELRPQFHCRVVHTAMHAAFQGFNRAQAAVIEAAILVSRLSFLPRDKVTQEMSYLQIAVGKTAGDAEREAWDWLMQAVTAHYAP